MDTHSVSLPSRSALPVLISPMQVCAMMGISRSTLERMSRRCPHFPGKMKLSAGCVRYRLDDVLAFIESHA